MNFLLQEVTFQVMAGHVLENVAKELFLISQGVQVALYVSMEKPPQKVAEDAKTVKKVNSELLDYVMIVQLELQHARQELQPNARHVMLTYINIKTCQAKSNAKHAQQGL